MFLIMILRFLSDRFRGCVVVFVVFVSVLLVGCTSSTNNGYDDQLIGNWSMIDEVGNFSYRIIYEFNSNLTFFTGVQNLSSQMYEYSLQGTYSVSDSYINLTVQNPYSTSDLKFSISEDGQTLMLYYENGTDYDVLTKELQS